MEINIRPVFDALRSFEPSLLILCGLPYAGKSHVARIICKAMPCAFVSIDEMLEKRGFDWNSSHLPDDTGWNEVFQASYHQTLEALKQGKNVLYDSTNHTRLSRDRLRDVAQRVGATAFVVFVDATPEVVRTRWVANQISKQRFVLSQKLLEQTIGMFERPEEDERVIRIENDGL